MGRIVMRMYLLFTSVQDLKGLKILKLIKKPDWTNSERNSLQTQSVSLINAVSPETAKAGFERRI